MRLRRQPRMRMNQFVYFTLRSETMSATEITARLGVEPDEITVRGSIQSDPVRPLGHAWTLIDRTPGLDVESLVDPLLDRMAPIASKVRELVDSGDAYALLQC